MVALNNIENPVVAAIKAAREAVQENRDGLRLPASSIGNPCERALWYGFRWVSAPKRFDGRMLRLFETGNVEEGRLIADLRRAGVQVVERDDRDASRQIGISFADGHAFGYLDGECSNVPGAPVVVHVLECKSHNAKSFKALQKDGLAASKPDHYAQMMSYMHVRKRTRGLYLSVCKDDDSLYAERIEYDLGFATSLMLKAERVIYADRPPSRLHEDPSSKAAFACGWCDHRGHCHEWSPARRTCRSCVHATPVAGGKWMCERHECELTREAQAAACAHHMLIPDLVHGRQVDADIEAGWIEYELADGTLWRDREGGGA